MSGVLTSVSTHFGRVWTFGYLKPQDVLAEASTPLFGSLFVMAHTQIPTAFNSQPDLDAAACSILAPSDTFIHRHIGPGATDVREMLDLLGYESLEDLVDATVPAAIRLSKPL